MTTWLITGCSTGLGRHLAQAVLEAGFNAVVGFHETLRNELGADGIRVTVIEPGAVWTEFGRNVPEQALRPVKQVAP
ncbi:hypothetical protein SAMN05519104_6965 [Rhizobiales bacterium GAS188]|nr:hypothetical protein SAMN05519104_6965 [Rhizobiales bacterium GAS188]